MSEFDPSPEPKQNKLQRWIKSIKRRREIRNIRKDVKKKGEEAQAYVAEYDQNVQQGIYTPERVAFERTITLFDIAVSLTKDINTPPEEIENKLSSSNANIENLIDFPEDTPHEEQEQRIVVQTFLNLLDDADQQKAADWILQQPQDKLTLLQKGVTNENIPFTLAIFSRIKQDGRFADRIERLSKKIDDEKNLVAA